MKTLICGSRTINNYSLVKQVINDSGFYITEVVSGGAKGVDSLAEQWAKEHNINVKHFLPNWGKYGKSAGVIRNQQMVDYANVIIAIWDGKSKGTKWTIDYALKQGRLKSYKEIENIKVYYIEKQLKRD